MPARLGKEALQSWEDVYGDSNIVEMIDGWRVAPVSDLTTGKHEPSVTDITPERRIAHMDMQEATLTRIPGRALPYFNEGRWYTLWGNGPLPAVLWSKEGGLLP